MCARIIQAIKNLWKNCGNAASDQYGYRRGKAYDAGHLHFKRLDLLAQIFRRPPYHKACYEDGHDGKSKHAI